MGFIKVALAGALGALPLLTTAAEENPLSIYTICVAAGFEEARPIAQSPLEAFARARLACGPFRQTLQRELSDKGMAGSEKAMRDLDLTLYRRLKEQKDERIATTLDDLERR